jgi:hypothetical protein
MSSAYKTFANKNKERSPVNKEIAAALDFEGAVVVGGAVTPFEGAVVVGGAVTLSVIAGKAWPLGVTST